MPAAYSKILLKISREHLFSKKEPEGTIAGTRVHKHATRSTEASKKRTLTNKLT